MDGPGNDEPAALNLHELCKFLAHFVQKISYVRLGALPPCWGRGGLFEKKSEKPLSTPFRHECKGKFIGSTMIMHKHDIG